MLTDEQFKYKIDKLKQKKSLHQDLAYKYEKEITRLTEERDIAKAESYLGKYIVYDGYFMKVERYEKTKYGIFMYGSGFKPMGDGISCVTALRCSWIYADGVRVSNEHEYVSKYKEIMSKIDKMLNIDNKN